jgi:hypothetical protein
MAGKTAATDLETRQAIYEGVSIAQLCAIFDSSNKTVSKKLAALAPIGVRGGHPIYKLSEAARYLVEPIYDPEEVIRRMNHRDLPPTLLKEFWTGQRAKQQYEEQAGHLWRTENVIEYLGEAFKVIRMSLLLLGDSVERETQFTERQRDILKRLVDSTLNGAADALVRKFGEEEHDSGTTAETADEEL